MPYKWGTLAGFNSGIAFSFCDRLLSVPYHCVQLQLPQMPAFSKAGPGSIWNAENTPQQTVGWGFPRGSQSRQLFHSPSFSWKEYVQTEGLFREQTCLTSASTSSKGEHQMTLRSSPIPAFIKVPGISETFCFLLPYILHFACWLCKLLSPPCSCVFLL